MRGGYMLDDEDYDPQNKVEMLLAEYINAAADLAESVKRNIKKDNKIDDKTVLILNEFMIVSNKIAFLTDKITTSNTKLN